MDITTCIPTSFSFPIDLLEELKSKAKACNSSLNRYVVNLQLWGLGLIK